MTALADAPSADVSALKPLNTKREVADFLGCSLDYVNALMRTGELGYYKRGHARQANVVVGRDHLVALLRSWER